MSAQRFTDDLMSGVYAMQLSEVSGALYERGVKGGTARDLRRDIDDPAISDDIYRLLRDLHKAGVVWRLRERDGRSSTIYVHRDFGAEYEFDDIIQSPLQQGIEALKDEIAEMRKRVDQLIDQRNAFRRRLKALGVIQEPEEW